MINAKFKNLLLSWNAIHSSALRYGVRHSVVLARFLHLFRTRRFSPHEIYFNDLLNPAVSAEALDRYMSFEESIEFDSKNALPSYGCVTMDKAVFHAICSTARLPTPKLIAVFDHPSGWKADGTLLRSRSDWCAFFGSLPEDFIVKPALGLQGRGVSAFRRDGKDFVDHESRRFPPDALYDFLQNKKRENLFSTGYSHHSLRLPQASHKTIIQERLFAHSSIAELTGSPSLCTVRLFTHIGRSASPRLIGCAIRIINGDNVADNLDRGSKGNLWCSVDPSTGRITEAFFKPKDADRLERVLRHPRTGFELPGFCVPHWHRAVELACHLAAVFAPQPSITWDIGIAEKGPVAVEGNLCGQLLPTPLNVPVNALLSEQFSKM